jgi:hypothetical protein
MRVFLPAGWPMSYAISFFGIFARIIDALAWPDPA